jgi:hypothetical protein
VAFNAAPVWKYDEKRRRAKHERFFELNGAPEQVMKKTEDNQQL